MKFSTAILAILFAFVQLSVATSLFEAMFQNEGTYSLYVEHLWFAIGGKDVPIPVDSTLASFSAAKAQGIVPNEATVDPSTIDSNKDGLISHQELYDNIKARMMSISSDSQVSSILNSVNDSHLQAAHKSVQTSFCDIKNPTSSMTIEDSKSCLQAGNCVARYMPCQAPSSRLQRRRFWHSLAFIISFGTLGVVSAVVAVMILAFGTGIAIFALPLLAVWLITWLTIGLLAVAN